MGVPSIPVSSGWSGLIGGGGGGGGGGGLDWTSLLLAGASQAAGGIAGAKSKKADRDAAMAQLQKTLDAKAASDRMSVAADESKLDPFRQQMAQAGDLSALDRLERATYTPVHYTPASDYAQYVPTRSGGASYTKSPELVKAAAALKRNIMGGNVDPTMTNPANYGKSGALDLLSIGANGVDPGTVSARSGVSPVSPTSGGTTDYMADVPRRGGGSTGGIGSKAAAGAALGTIVPGVGNLVGAGAGALVGALTGAFGRHSSTAATDFSVADASNVLTRAIQSELGRDPLPGEIDRMLKAQGLKPGDRWVGQAGLSGLLNQIRSSASAGGGVPSYTGRG